MKTCIAIRTYQWGPDEKALVERLGPVFGDNVVVALHTGSRNTTDAGTGGFDIDIPVACFGDDWVKDNGLRVLEDYGWRCGDYALYALRQKFPDYERYWLIEPDVALLGDYAAFFEAADQLTYDGAGVDLEDMSQKPDRFTKGLPEFTPYRATFAFTRFSGAAIDYLFEERQKYSASSVGPWRFANDEIFCFSHLAAQSSFTTGSFGEDLPEWFDLKLFASDPDLLESALLAHVGQANQICHPVRDFDGFVGAVSGRLSTLCAGVLRQMRLSLRDMDDQQKTQFVEMFSEKIQAEIQSLSEETKL